MDSTLKRKASYLDQVEQLNEVLQRAKRLVQEQPSAEEIIRNANMAVHSELQKMRGEVGPDVQSIYESCRDELEQQLSSSFAVRNSHPVIPATNGVGCFCNRNPKARILVACELCDGPPQYYCIDGIENPCNHLNKMPCSSKYAGKYICNECSLKHDLAEEWNCKYPYCTCGVWSDEIKEHQRTRLNDETSKMVVLNNGKPMDQFAAYWNSCPSDRISSDIVYDQHPPALLSSFLKD